MSVLLPPGTYTVKLSGAGPELSQQLIVKKDPNSEGTEADINAQVALLFELRKDLETAADMVNQIEVIRSQLAGITALLGLSEPPAVAGGSPAQASQGRPRGVAPASARGSDGIICRLRRDQASRRRSRQETNRR